MKVNKIFSIDVEIAQWLKENKPNVSAWVNDALGKAIMAEMAHAGDEVFNGEKDKANIHK